MEPSQMITEIFDDIEFEIAQGIVSKGEISQGLEAVRQYQNNNRFQTFKSIKISNIYREIFNRQYKTVDMLLNLLQEMALILQSIQHDVRRLNQISPTRRLPTEIPEKKIRQGIFESIDTSGTEPEESRLASKLKSPDEITNAVQLGTIFITPQAQPVRWPIIGWLIMKLKMLYQRPALFYSQLLAGRQAPVNQILGDHILQLETIVAEQQRQIQALKSQITSLKDQTHKSDD